MTESKKYELTKESVTFRGRTLYRIRALRDFGDVKKGDLGGYLEKEENLSHNGTCWVYDDAMIWGNGLVSDHAQVSGNALVCGNAWIYASAQVSGHAKVFGNAQIFGGAQVSDYAQVFEHAWIYGSTKVSGSAVVKFTIRDDIISQQEQKGKGGKGGKLGR